MSQSASRDHQHETSGKGRSKRKRGAEEVATTPTSTDCDASTPGPANKAKVKARGSRAKSKPPLRAEASAAVDCVVEWPPLFKSLEKTHRALNIVFTFCCTRKHLITTFNTIKPTVETHIGRDLTVEEVASIVALRPEGINFTYVDELMLQLDIKGSERDDTFKNSRSSRSQAPAHDASVGGFTGTEGLGDESGKGRSGREVLYFEFIDGDLKRQVQDKKTGEPTPANRKLREEELKMPVFSQKQMTQLIDRRNQRFTTAINIFLNENPDPENVLKQRTEAFLPVPSPVEVEQVPSTIPEDIPKERKTIPEIIEELKGENYTGQIVPDGHRVFEPQAPIYGDLDFLLSQNLVNALYNTISHPPNTIQQSSNIIHKGITQFYAHQAEALNSLHHGQNVVVATSTSSGKSLIYQLPVLHALEDDFNSRAMYIFPTKALAQDQKRSLKEMIAYMPGLEETMVETFDGDTPMNQRNDIREQARIIFTNPDMLHVTILPQEERWRTFLKNLKYVVGE